MSATEAEASTATLPSAQTYAIVTALTCKKFSLSQCTIQSADNSPPIDIEETACDPMRGGGLTLLLRRLRILSSLALVSLPTFTQAQNSVWAACRAEPKRACVLDEAIRSARSLTQAYFRAKGLIEIVQILSEGARFDDALALSASLPQDGDSNVVRVRLAAALAEAGRFSDAGQTTRAIRDPGWRAVAEAALSEALATKGDVEAAKAKTKLALQLADNAGQSGDFAIRRIAIAMIRSRETDKAIATVRAIASPHWRLRGLLDVAKILSATQSVLALKLLREAYEIAATQGPPVRTIYDMSDIAVAQANAGGLAEARTTLERAAQVARNFSDPGSRDTFLEVVGIGLVKAGLTAEAAALVPTMDGDWQRVKVATAVAAAEAKAGRLADSAKAYDLAKQAANNGRPTAKPHLHAYIAESEAAAGLVYRVAASLDQMDKATSLVDTTRRSSSFAKSVMTRIRLSGEDTTALLAAITDAGVRNAALGSLVQKEIEANRLDAARAAALNISSPHDRAYSLSLVAVAQVKGRKIGDAFATLDAIPSIHYRRVNVLAIIAAAMDQ
jgi:tetratricopeptide (TPR) repeat protein